MLILTNLAHTKETKHLTERTILNWFMYEKDVKLLLHSKHFPLRPFKKLQKSEKIYSKNFLRVLLPRQYLKNFFGP